MMIEVNLFPQHSSAWLKQWCCDDLRPLIICRGPIRKEAMDVFSAMGIHEFGILLSEKDSIVYPGALAPEVRHIKPQHVHRVEDYLIKSDLIIQIARQHGYNSIFAGYGFMAKDNELIQKVQDSGLIFIGPGAQLARQVAHKDEARKIALRNSVAVAPGVNDLVVRTLLKRYPDVSSLRKCIRKHKLNLPEPIQSMSKEDLAQAMVQSAVKQSVELITFDDMAAQALAESETLWKAWPGRRIRLQAAGPSKSQRILTEAEKDLIPGFVKEVLQEAKASQPNTSKRTVNRNILIEINIEQGRHQAVQLVGNGAWCVSLGGLDCSVQMPEQKLLAFSLTEAELSWLLRTYEVNLTQGQRAQLQKELDTLMQLEQEAETFGKNIGLDSVAAFEALVSPDEYAFMGMNAGIQKEHRVTELCYGLKFTNPDNADEHFVVQSLVEMMTLLAVHGERLPRPARVSLRKAALEIHLNASNAALLPHAGSCITEWSPPQPEELRDDQGISLPNPDTRDFMPYAITGAYDNHIALLLVSAQSRPACIEKMIKVIECTYLQGQGLQTNLSFHYGLLHWIMSQHSYARINNEFISQYLAHVDLTARAAGRLDLIWAYEHIEQHWMASKVDVTDIFARKRNLLLRPLQKLQSDAHLLAGWLSQACSFVEFKAGQVMWKTFPLALVRKTYQYLGMLGQRTDVASYNIWLEDLELLEQGIMFYQTSQKQPGVEATDLGYRLGMELWELMLLCAFESGFYELRVDDNLEVRCGQSSHAKQDIRDQSESWVPADEEIEFTWRLLETILSG